MGWMYVESVIFILIAYYLDQVLPLNDVKPKKWYFVFKQIRALFLEKASCKAPRNYWPGVFCVVGIGGYSV